MPKKTNIFCFLDYETTGTNEEKLPLQIGAIFANDNFQEVGRFSSYFKYPEHILFDKHGDFYEWKSEYQEAYDIHKIEPETILEQGEEPFEVVRKFKHKVTNITGHAKVDRAIIVSDQILMECEVTEKLFNEHFPGIYPFHYAPWSINFLYHFFNPTRREKPHDALADAEIMLLMAQECKEKIDKVMKEQ